MAGEQTSSISLSTFDRLILVVIALSLMTLVGFAVVWYQDDDYCCTHVAGSATSGYYCTAFHRSASEYCSNYWPSGLKVKE